MDKDARDDIGPTWADVMALSEGVERRFNLTVVTLVRFFPSGKQSPATASVVAEARRGGHVGAEVVAYGHHGFRGANGAKTMPAAMYVALLRLHEQLDDRKDKAAQQHAF